MRRISAVLMCLCLGYYLSGTACAEGEKMAIQKGSKVAFQYKLTVDGQVIDSSKDGEPLNYTQGQGELIPGLENQLEGMHAGETKTVTVSPEQAYGPVVPDAVQEVDRSQLPQGVEIKAGTPLQVRSPDGRARIVKIAEVKEKTVMVDFNHPLAGKTLNFDVKIESVQ